jgi:UDP-N-acetylglucosamine--dolichyl-phosphate N-acetylglucosaminephosphotransferase
MVLSLLAFLRYNWFPAKIFPGDSLTYSVGALIACVAILANAEKIAVILFIPYFLDFLLPLRKKMKVEAFGKPAKDGSIEVPYDKIYDTAHAIIVILKRVKGKAYEYEVTLLILVIEALIAILTLRWFLG